METSMIRKTRASLESDRRLQTASEPALPERSNKKRRILPPRKRPLRLNDSTPGLLAQEEATSKSKYEYTSLPGSDYIRLLQLHRRDNDVSTITGSLVFRKLDDEEPKYMTISYSWGRDCDGFAGLTHDIFIDGRALAITENLYDLLIQLSKPACANQGPIWVDAVCINQADTDERSSQVSMMSTIYQKASSLTIWLGNGANEEDDRKAAKALNSLDSDGAGEEKPPTEGTIPACSHHEPPVFSKMSRVQVLAFQVALVLTERYSPGSPGREDYRRDIPDNLGNWLWPRLIRYASSGLTEWEVYANLTVHERPRQLLRKWRIARHLVECCRYVGREDIIYAFHESVVALYKLYQRRYFKRRWILQEIYHSQLESMMIRWDSYACRCEQFVEIFEDVGDIAKYLDLFDEFDNYERSLLHERVSEILQIRGAKEDRIGRPPDLPVGILELLARFSDTKCSDDRDLFYALRGLAVENKLPAADYSLSAEETFHALAVSLVDNGTLGAVLAAAAAWQYQYSDRPRHDGELDTFLPSWVPDLRYAIPYSFSYIRARDSNSKASVTDDGKDLTFFAKVGRRGEDQYLCQVEGACGDEFLILIPVISEQDCFVLDGYVNGFSDNPWELWGDVGMRRIRLR